MSCNNVKSIFKGDDTNSFGQQFLVINATIPEGYTVSKAEFKCGSLPVMTFDNPTFPLSIELTATQTKLLTYQNQCYLKVYDQNGLGQTCTGTAIFKAKAQVI